MLILRIWRKTAGTNELHSRTSGKLPLQGAAGEAAARGEDPHLLPGRNCCFDEGEGRAGVVKREVNV
ncbi:unnamed protein product [Victoria cruziana]